MPFILMACCLPFMWWGTFFNGQHEKEIIFVLGMLPFISIKNQKSWVLSLVLWSIFSLSWTFGSGFYHTMMFTLVMCLIGSVDRDFDLELYYECLSLACIPFILWMLLELSGVEVLRYLEQFMNLGGTKLAMTPLPQLKGPLVQHTRSGAWLAIAAMVFWRGKLAWLSVLIGVLLYFWGSSMALGSWCLGSWWLLPKKWKKITATLGIGVILAGLYSKSEWMNGQDRWVILAKTLKEMGFTFSGVGFGYVTDHLPLWSKQIGVLPFTELHNDWIEGYYALGIPGMGMLLWGVYRAFRVLDPIGQAMLVSLGFNALANFPLHLAPVVALIIPVLGKGINSVDGFWGIDKIIESKFWRKYVKSFTSVRILCQRVCPITFNARSGKKV